MSDRKLQPWDSAISEARHLANHQVAAHGRSLNFSLADLVTHKRHFFMFDDVLGFRHQIGFNMQRIGNSFLVVDSTWVQELQSEPFGTTRMDSARHYLFDSHDGQFEVIALREPVYRCTSDG